MVRLIFSSVFIFLFFTGMKAKDMAFPEIENFKREIRSDVFFPENLFDLINGGAEVYLEYNFLDLHLCEYKVNDIVITVEAYNHGNLANAFGIYSSERSADYHFINVGTEGYQEDAVLNFFQGKYYIKINGYSESGVNIDKHIKTVAETISDFIEEEKEYPYTLKLLPKENKIPYSDGYINNSFMGYSYFNNVYLAKYHIAGEFTFFVIENETDEIAQETLERYLIKAGQSLGNNKNGIYKIDDTYSGRIYITKFGEMLLGTINCDDLNISNNLFQQFQKTNRDFL